LITSCGHCEKVCNEICTSPRLQSDTSSRPPFEVNRKVVSGFLQIGRGISAIEQFSMVMGLRGMSSSTYSAHVKYLSLEKCENQRRCIETVTHSNATSPYRTKSRFG
ncbi:hypothetical protein L9F63_017562, partial [Diploptera punctata]